MGLEVAKDVALAEVNLLPYQQMLSQHALHLSLVRLLQVHHHAAAEHAKLWSRWAPSAGSHFGVHGFLNVRKQCLLCPRPYKHLHGIEVVSFAR